MDEEAKELPWIDSIILYKKSDVDFKQLEIIDVKVHINESGEKVRMIYLKDKGDANA